MDYNYNYSQNSEPDYYEIYTKQQIKKAKGVFSRFHFGILIYLIGSFVASFIIEIILISAFGVVGAGEFLTEHRYVYWLWCFLPMYAFALPIFFLFVRKMKTMPMEKKRINFSEFCSFFLVAELAMWCGSAIGNIFGDFFAMMKGGAVTDRTDELISTMPIWLIILVVVIIGPIAEELMFRKLMIDRLSMYGNAVAITVSAVSFGIFHGNFYQLFLGTLVGFVLGFMYAKTRNISYTIAIHMLLNFFGTIVPLPVMTKSEEILSMLESIQTGIEVNIADFFADMMIVASYTIVQYAILIGGAIMLYRFIKHKKYKIRDCWEYKIPREQTASTVIANPGTVLFLVFSVLIFAYSIFA